MTALAPALREVVPHASSPAATATAPVVRVIARLNVGGPALHAIYVTGGVSERFPTTLVTGRVAEGEADMIDVAYARELDVHLLPELGREVHLWDDVTVLVKLYRLFRRLRPAVVHTHTAKAGTLGRLAAFAARVPVRVHTFHGHVFHGYFGPLKTRLYVLIERLLARLTTRIVAISASQADDLADRYRICARERIRVIPLGLELDAFAPARSAALGPEFRREVGAGDDPVVTIVGRLAPIKNHALFLEAAARLHRAGRRCRFVIVGGGTEEEDLRRRVRELGIEDVVVFAGWRTDLDRVYAGSDLVVLTSRNEGTPVCLIEALTAGCAVVATDVGGVRDVLEDGRLGVVVPPGDAAALAEAIGGLLDHPERRTELGRRGAASAPRRFGVRRLLDDIESLYDELVASAS